MKKIILNKIKRVFGDFIFIFIGYCVALPGGFMLMFPPGNCDADGCTLYKIAAFFATAPLWLGFILVISSLLNVSETKLRLMRRGVIVLPALISVSVIILIIFASYS